MVYIMFNDNHCDIYRLISVWQNVITCMLMYFIMYDKLIITLHHAGKYPLTTTMEMRWISHSDTLLAPAIIGKPNGYTFYLEILSFEETDNAIEFFLEVAEFWETLECDRVKPLPHWGKQ